MCVSSDRQYAASEKDEKDLSKLFKFKVCKVGNVDINNCPLDTRAGMYGVFVSAEKSQ